MSRFRRMSQTAKERFNQGLQIESIEDDSAFSALTPEPSKSVALPVAGTDRHIRVGTLVSGMQRADE